MCQPSQRGGDVSISKTLSTCRPRPDFYYNLRRKRRKNQRRTETRLSSSGRSPSSSAARSALGEMSRKACACSFSAKSTAKLGQTCVGLLLMGSRRRTLGNYSASALEASVSDRRQENAQPEEELRSKEKRMLRVRQVDLAPWDAAARSGGNAGAAQIQLVVQGEGGAPRPNVTV